MMMITGSGFVNQSARDAGNCLGSARELVVVVVRKEELRTTSRKLISYIKVIPQWGEDKPVGTKPYGIAALRSPSVGTWLLL